MDWQNQNSDYNNQNPYTNPYQNPYQRPYPPAPAGDKLAGASLVMGILTIVSLFSMTVYPPFIFGSLGIVFALLSKGKVRQLAGKAKAGIGCAVAGLIANIVLVCTCMYLFVAVQAVHKQVNDAFQDIYGVTFDEMYEDILNGENNYDPF